MWIPGLGNVTVGANHVTHIAEIKVAVEREHR
jgi:hypothetical protein